MSRSVRTTPRARRAVLAACLVLAGTVTAPAGAAGAVEPEVHCVATVIGERDGIYETTEPVCFASMSESLAFTDPVLDATTADEALVDATVGEESLASSTTTIGWHFTGLSYSGSSIRIEGTTCSGGAWLPTGAWDNTIESSYHYCGTSPTRFFDTGACGGDVYAITASASTLSTMNNRTSCVQYG